VKTAEIREAFLRFFEQQQHTRVLSSSLVPAGDPTLLFANAGMVQFKDTFLGMEKRPYVRATTCQKCLRISGKHNDLENVGRTARHHTFFEMLGNFSFGDYFKQEAITFAWKFVTETLALPKNRLWVTVFKDDDEAASLWREQTDVLDGRILRRGEKDNFWAMGDTGPCGPCSEIFYYLGSDEQAQKAEELLADVPEYLEIWNLVFMQFNRDAQGKLAPLPRPSVDTGMGLERVAAIKQGTLANYDSDLLRSIISLTEELSGKSYDGRDYTERNPEQDPQYAVDVAMRVIADHCRAAAFLVADEVLPSSDGRGYVLRRLIRRACRHGRILGLRQPFLYKASLLVQELMADAYPELSAARQRIEKVIRMEEEKFLQTLDTGLLLLKKEVENIKAKGLHVFPGESAFLLHDTYGFPLDLTEDLLRVHGLGVDHDGFSQEMEAQRERSRSARASETALILQRAVKPTQTVFVGYEFEEYESEVLGLYNESGAVASARDGDEVALVAKETPFYAESGGQVGDTGRISSGKAALDVIDCQKAAGDTFVHICRVIDGEISTKDRIRLSIDSARRAKMRLNHSATHLLHLALRDVLGSHVKQAGSRVSEKSLRFDFSQLEPVTQEHLVEIERIVNELIRENHQIETISLPIEEAKRSGAVALFGEKYGEVVRVVSVCPRSREFCGGTHAKRTGDIGLLSILSEGSISAGVHRIEAVSGPAAFLHAQSQKELLRKLSLLLSSSEQNLAERVERIVEQNKTLEKEVLRLGQKINSGKTGDLSEKAVTLASGTKVLASVLEEVSPKQLREIADDLRARLGSSCIALATVQKGKAVFLTAVTDDLLPKYHAGELLREVASVAGSKGGGKADLAQAGGGDPEKIEQALRRFQELVQ
jgi:alanyl-tRNA synthetase